MESHRENDGGGASLQVTVNGQRHALQQPATVTALLVHLGLAGRRLAVEVNRQIVPRSAHDSHQLAEGDQIELVQAIGGG